MKTAASVAVRRPPHGGTGIGEGESAELEPRTREAVVRLLVSAGPLTASELAGRLGISAAGIRRHLDQLAAEGAIVARSARSPGPRGRGRPAKAYLLSELGRARLPHSYDRLAVDALTFLADEIGTEAVTAFARRRAAAVVRDVTDRMAATRDLRERTEILAGALSEQGFSATVEHMEHGDQICQHHCPIAAVAAQYPQLCEAETAALTSALASHGQRLATIARGDSFCTTFIPISAVRDPRPRPDGTTDIHHQEGIS